MGYYGVIISNNEIGVNEFCSGSEYGFAQGVIMNDEGDAVEFSPRNARKVWSSEKKEVIGFLFFQQSVSFSCPNFENPTIMMILLFMIGMIHKIVTNLPRRSQAKEVKKASIMEKTKKNVALEASLFRLLIEDPV